MKITILGNGIFGSALATYLSKKGHTLVDKAGDSELIFVCVTSNMVLPSLLEIKKEISTQKIIICSKGFAKDGKLISEVLEEKFKNRKGIYYLYGPSLAEELDKGVPTGMVLAGKEGKEELKKEIESNNLYIELSSDVIGVETSAALKNVMAILIGVVEGRELGQNANALIFVKAVEEIKNIGIALGGKIETFIGLSCVGDLYLSSRNRCFGIELGKCKSLEEIIKETNYTPAGVYDIKDAKIMVEKLGLNAPLIESLNKIVFEKYPVEDAVNEIISI
jgi:glycerol-3-phosphate dehydrogenase (NAD(P)+)